MSHVNAGSNDEHNANEPSVHDKNIDEQHVHEPIVREENTDG